ncbi:PfkB family carbohydrate kinase [Candidatus Pelagibacter sp.]|nr:PfkB family carbohydrate kinase [Candidatus Pelagibacter sp.]
MKKKINVFISGNFNIVHPGHIRLFKFAKKIGKNLTVAIKSDNLAKSDAYINEKLRFDALKNISLIDNLYIEKKNINKLILKLKPDIILKGKEYKKQKNLEEDVLKKVKAKIVFSKDNVIFSSSDLISKEIDNTNESNQIISDYFLRNSIKKSNLKKLISNFKKLNVCVIGDLIIDEYNYCEPLGMSREESVIVVKFNDKKTFLGGAGAVASYAKKLCNNVYFFSVMGKDKINKFANSELKKRKIFNNILVDNTRPTTVKVRFRDEQKSLLRVSYLDSSQIDISLQDKLYNDFKKISNKLDLVIFSDFNYGCLPKKLVDRIFDLCKKKNIMMSADSQSSSQDGDISRFQSMNLITPTEKEARLCILDNEIGIENLIKKIMLKSKSKNTILKLGSEGLIVSKFSNSKFSKVDRLPAINKNKIIDVSGAGDAMLTIASLSLASNSSIWEASYLGSIASSIAITKYGNIPILYSDLVKEIKD